MNYVRYKIIYDIDRDIWNWYYGANYSDSSAQLKELNEIEAVNSIVGVDSLELADPKIRPFLNSEFSNENSKLNEFIKIAQNEFKDKFADACAILERITKHPLSNEKFTFFVTTFPRMTVFFEEGIIFMYAKIDKELWGMPIDGFLHEGLHFQFNKYWREDENSPVSKLSEDDYFILKESLTVILDEELMPTITLPDCSYYEFIDYRRVLHENWKKYHDFDQLVVFGLNELPKYTKNTN